MGTLDWWESIGGEAIRGVTSLSAHDTFGDEEEGENDEAVPHPGEDHIGVVAAAS